jgi:hypothetical protein
MASASAKTTPPATSAMGNAISRYAIRMSGCTPRKAEMITVPSIANNKLTAKQSNVPINVTTQTRTSTATHRDERDESAGGIPSILPF